MRASSLLIGILTVVLFNRKACAVVVASREMDAARQWVAARFDGGSGGGPSDADPPFSFRYAGRPSSVLLRAWRLKRTSRKLDGQRTEYTITYTDPRTRLVVRCLGVAYQDFPTVEWTLYFENTGMSNTPILEDIQALDVSFNHGLQGELLLHHAVGSPADGSDYAPLVARLGPKTTRSFAGGSGRPTSRDWSYFNLEWSGSGVMLAVGWPGQWAAVFERDQGANLRMRAGQERTHFVLRPGEAVRSPLIVLQFWRGDWIRAQNVWRRWMMAHSMPRPGGKLPRPMILASSALQTDIMVGGNEANQLLFIDRYLDERLPIEYWWMDAGWYVNETGWQQVGTWEADVRRFPRGLRFISDHAHHHGVKTLVWFEPERVAPNTWLASRHPEWILGGAKGGLLNLGNPEARRWLTEHIDGLLTKEGIDLYRQDFNIEPLDYWRGNDAPDRQGITEIEYVTGYLNFFDELRRRHPNMLIDSCASGGRRNDVETLRRAVPLWRSDYPLEEPVGQQGMTYGISLWLPFHGTGTQIFSKAVYDGSKVSSVEIYSFWSNTSPGLLLMADVRSRRLDYVAFHRLVGQWRALSPNYYGDYYPLTPYTRDKTTWIGWQFDRPEGGQGMIQVFRRKNSPVASARFALRGLETRARYRLTDLGTGRTIESIGRELMGRGLLVSVPEKPGVAILAYRKVSEVP